MDDLWKRHLLFLMLSLTLLGGIPLRAEELEYISPERIHTLADQFRTAQVNEADRNRLTNHKSWSCAMYGVRTRMQVQHDLKLYELSLPIQDPKTHSSDVSLENHGSHPVVAYSYKPDLSSYVGKTERVQDELRMTSKGQLIARLSALTPAPTVIAYALCDAM